MAPPQLLLVEDDPQLVRALVPALEVCGHSVTVANDGASAINELDRGAWDAMVVDLGLPDMDGRAVLRHLRLTSSIPVVVISARHSPEDLLECGEAGADHFLTKPFAMPELIEHLESALAAKPCGRPNSAHM